MAEVHNAAYSGDLRVAVSSLAAIEPERMPVDRLFEELQRVKQYACSRASGTWRLHLAPDVDDPAVLRTFYHDHLAFVGGRGCTDPWKMMMIKTDGAVIPSHGRCYDFPVGNVTDQALRDIWNGSRFVEFRQTLRRAGGSLPACARCCGVIGKPIDA